ncbi:MAG: hypothetical protein ACI8T1_002564 [Verrucomicrobiales bacterium]
MKLPPFLVTALVIILMLLPSPAQMPSPYIAEFMTDNRGTLFDEDEDAGDWIEIHHRGDTAMSLEGHALTDDPEIHRKWEFPNIIMDPDERLIVFASGKDRRPANGTLHANFSLDADGEYLALIGRENQVLSEWATYTAQGEDESYGESSDRRPLMAIDTKSSCRWLVPFGSREDLSWTANAFNDSQWFPGASGLGYDVGLDYHEWILTDLFFDMDGFATTVQIRYPFEVVSSDDLLGAILHIRFDDGFAAFINGVRVAEEAAPETLLTNSRATSGRDPIDGIQEMRFDLADHLDLMEEGTNVLAIQGLDESSSSGDFLIHPRLELLVRVENPGFGLLAEPTPGAPNRESYAGRVKDVVFEQTPRFIDAPLDLTMTCDTPGAEIFFTFNGEVATREDGFLYEVPVSVDETLAVRARAFKEGLLPSYVTTRTYVLPSELAAQGVLNRSVVDDGGRAVVEQNMRRALPIVSIAVDPDAIFGDGGLDTVPQQTRKVPVSLEYFSDAEPDKFFQVDAGLGIHGGNAREHPKKPFRLFFKREFGPPRLEFPLFEDSPVAGFDQLILRAGGHDSWSISPDFGSSTFDLPFHATYLRDQFLRKTELEMGLLSPHGRYVQLLLNGFYWGIYDLHERPNASFFRDHLGGMKRDWDVLHHADTLDTEWAVVDGSDENWNSLHQRLIEGINSPEDYQSLQEQLDMDGLIDSLLVRIWSGDFDWAGPTFLDGDEVTFFRNKNWYAGQRSRSEPGFFQFFTWDGEMSMGLHLLSNIFGQSIDQRVVNFDLTGVDDPGTPSAFHGALRILPDYRRRFGDRVQKHLFENGVLAISQAQARLDAMVAALDSSMVAESARWGDLHFGQNFTREGHWLPEIDWMRDTFIPERREVLLDQLRERGLFPEVAGVRMTPVGGSLDTIDQVRLASTGGTIHFTTDGTDPATSVGFNRRVLVDGFSSSHFLVPSIANGGSALGDTWKDVEAPSFFETWAEATASIGYETGENFFQPHFETDLSEMDGVNTSVYVRVLFDLESVENVESLVLRMKYDDGFAAFLNGAPLVADSDPDMLTWFSESTFRRPDEDAVLYRDFDVRDLKGLLRDGSNLLAIQGLNGAINSSDLLMSPQLIVVEAEGNSISSPAASVYAEPLAFTEATTLKARVLADDGEWSALTEGFFYPGQLPDAASLRITEIHYHPLASDDQPSSAFEFVELTNVSSEALQLAGVRFSEGISLVFDPISLGAGEWILVVNDRAAFLSRYGEAFSSQIVGEYGAESRLSNGGEMLTLVDADGNVIDRVSYDDGGAADGEGVSLVRIDLAGGSDPSNWRVSKEQGGSPGEAGAERTYALWRSSHFPDNDAMGELSADPDRDLRVNLVEYFQGSDPQKPNEGSSIQIRSNPDDTFTLSYTRLTALNDVSVSIEGSCDLAEWAPQFGIAETESLGGGISNVSYKVTASASRWYRLKLSLKE